MLMNSLKRMLLAGAALMIVGGAASAQTRLQLSTGVDYSSGDYGDTVETKVVAVPFSARLTLGDFAVRASIPYLSVDGPAGANVLFEGGGAGAGGGGNGGGGVIGDDDGEATPSTAAATTENGFGDLSLAAIYAFNDIADTPTYLEVTGRVRLPTGDADKGLGIDATDYATLAELGYAPKGGGVYVLGGRRFLENADGVRREDGWQAGFGGWYEVSDRMTLGAFYDYRQASVDGNDDPSEAGLYTTLKLSPKWRLGANVSAGLSDASPEYAGGLTLSYRLIDRP